MFFRRQPVLFFEMDILLQVHLIDFSIKMFSFLIHSRTELWTIEYIEVKFFLRKQALGFNARHLCKLQGLSCYYQLYINSMCEIY